MMKRKIPFEKYEGAGNDFILFDFFEFDLVDLTNRQLMELLCHRHYGIGADGILALCKNNLYDFEMKYLNADGRFSSFCGNGSRCISNYAAKKFGKRKLHFLASDGEHFSEILEDDLVKVKMKDISEIKNTEFGVVINSGSPHLIIPEEKPLTNLNLEQTGRQLRNQFQPDGINVNFVTYDNLNIKMTTYERGVENLTLACGTGITAAHPG